MKILVTGITGLVGKELGKKLVTSGHEIVAITRDKYKAAMQLPFPCQIVEWDVEKNEFPSEALQGVNTVIHLAGESVGAGRWSEKRKQEILESRQLGTKKLAAAVEKYVQSVGGKNLKTFISASAIGIYGNCGDQEVDETTDPGIGFLAEVVKEWEKPIKELVSKPIRTVSLRIGIVLSRQGGALEKMLPLFTLGFGGVAGNGHQWMSWIHMDDLVDIFVHSITSESVSGVYNAVAPTPSTNRDFSATLAASLLKRLFLPAPSFALKLGLGEMSTLVLEGQKVSSKKIASTGFQFHYPTLDVALKEICAPLANGDHEILAEQWIPQKPEEVFPFFSDEKNLETLTPAYLNFKVLKKSTPKLESGTLIDYGLSLHGIPLKWRSLIELWDPNSKFVDTQLKGPYKKWYHTHYFVPFAGGTLLRDVVHYRVPLGFLGNLFALPKIKSDIKKIFNYRRKMITDLFYLRGVK
ncbi:MAG: TIGR01777 family oxidoreductase [Bacteriovoracaceae bacterium]|nr:TIGR01777 family oxidoreductase [Bacteriovoracaceae bacterium]